MSDEEITRVEQERERNGGNILDSYPDIPELTPLATDLDEVEIGKHVPKWWWEEQDVRYGSERSSSSSQEMKEEADSHLPPLPPRLVCPRPLHTSQHLLPLNTPIYIATDTPSPTTHAALIPFLEMFPCTFFLSTLPLPPPLLPSLEASSSSSSGLTRSHHDSTPSPILASPPLSQLQRLTHERSRTSLWPVMIPFLDGLIAAGGRLVLGTAKSTFSTYVEDMEWRRTWGIEPLLK